VNEDKIAALIYIVAIGVPLIFFVWACIAPTKPTGDGNRRGS
jgi:hypothetical protein